MIDDAVMVEVAPAGDLIALDLWAGDCPDLGGVEMMRVEPARWWLIGASDRLDELAARIGDNGAWAPIGGGLLCATLTGPGWRSLLGVSGVFDADGARVRGRGGCRDGDPSCPGLDRGGAGGRLPALCYGKLCSDADRAVAGDHRRAECPDVDRAGRRDMRGRRAR